MTILKGQTATVSIFCFMFILSVGCSGPSNRTKTNTEPTVTGLEGSPTPSPTATALPQFPQTGTIPTSSPLPEASKGSAPAAQNPAPTQKSDRESRKAKAKSVEPKTKDTPSKPEVKPDTTATTPAKPEVKAKSSGAATATKTNTNTKAKVAAKKANTTSGSTKSAASTNPNPKTNISQNTTNDFLIYGKSVALLFENYFKFVKDNSETFDSTSIDARQIPADIQNFNIFLQKPDEVNFNTLNFHVLTVIAAFRVVGLQDEMVRLTKITTTQVTAVKLNIDLGKVENYFRVPIGEIKTTSGENRKFLKTAQRLSLEGLDILSGLIKNDEPENFTHLQASLNSLKVTLELETSDNNDIREQLKNVSQAFHAQGAMIKEILDDDDLASLDLQVKKWIGEVDSLL